MRCDAFAGAGGFVGALLAASLATRVAERQKRVACDAAKTAGNRPQILKRINPARMIVRPVDPQRVIADQFRFHNR